MKSIFHVVLFFALLLAPSSWPVDPYNAQDEITRLRNELAGVQAERSRTKNDVDRDRQEQESYLQRTKARRRGIEAETDSVMRETATAKRAADSLLAVVAALQNQRRQFDLLENQTRLRIAEGCDSFALEARRMPPHAGPPIASSLTFLKSELAGRSIDNVEALQRLEQIVRDLHEAAMSVQDVVGPSPVAEIKSSASILRLGAIFEGASDEKGTVAALWQGLDNHENPRWSLTRDKSVAGEIAQAVAMRQGKALPSIVHLPFGPAVPAGESSK